MNKVFVVCHIRFGYPIAVRSSKSDADLFKKHMNDAVNIEEWDIDDPDDLKKWGIEP
jgi:hypothetical protein